MKVIEILNRDLAIADMVLKKQSTWKIIKQKCVKKCKKKAVEEESDDDEEQLDDIKYKLNRYLARELAARENWKKIKFRLLVIQKFSSLTALQKKLEIKYDESDDEDYKKKNDPSIPKWFIIDSESRNK